MLSSAGHKEHLHVGCNLLLVLCLLVWELTCEILKYSTTILTVLCLCLGLFVGLRGCLCTFCMCDCVCVCVCDDPAQATAGPQPWLQHGQHWWSQDALAAFTKVGRDRVIRPPTPQQSHLLMPCLLKDKPKSTPVGIFGWDVWWRGWVGWAGIDVSQRFIRIWFSPSFLLGIFALCDTFSLSPPYRLSVCMVFLPMFALVPLYARYLILSYYYEMAFFFIILFVMCVKVRMFTFCIFISSIYRHVCPCAS